MNDTYKLQLPDGTNYDIPPHPTNTEVNDVLTLAEGIQAQMGSTHRDLNHVFWRLEGRQEHIQGLINKRTGRLGVITVHGVKHNPPTLSMINSRWHW